MNLENKLDIVNHSVKVNDIGLLQFMYPDFVIVSRAIMYSDKPIIYIGENKYLNQIKNLGVDYILVTELAEIDLTQRDKLLKVVFNHYNKEVPKYVLEFYNDLDDDTFMDLCKHYWVTGKWLLKEYDNTGAFLEFLYSFKTDTLNITKTYLSLLNKVGAEYIEMSLFTFLNRVVTSTGNVSKWYKRTIDEYKRSKSNLIEKAITNYCESPIYNSELRLYNLIIDLNKQS